MEMQEWLDATNNTVILWSDLDSERVSLENNLEKLNVRMGLYFDSADVLRESLYDRNFLFQNLKQKLPEEKYRIDEVRDLGEKVLPGTSDDGKSNITKQIDTSQQDWEILLTTVG